jgi:hypothetical protein
MPKIKNVSPFGDLMVPLLGIEFKHGSIIDVTEEEARILLMQEDNFKPWGPDAREALDKEKAAEADEPKKAGDIE